MSVAPRNQLVSSAISVPLSFDELSKNVQTNTGTIIGCIVNCYPIQPSKAFDKYRKLLLRELDPIGTLKDRVLPCFLYGVFVDQTRELKKGNILTINGFEVKPNLQYVPDSVMYPYQVDVITTPMITPVVTVSDKKIIRFDELEMISKPYGGAYIVGRVMHCYALKKLDFRDSMKKLILKDELPDGQLGNISMECILYDKIANQNRLAKVGDTIKFTGFWVEARPSTSSIQNFYQYHVVLDPQRETEFNQPPITYRIGSVKFKPDFRADVDKPTTYNYTCLKDLHLDSKNGNSARTHFHVYGVVVQCMIINSNTNESLRIVVSDPTKDSFTVFVRNRSDACEIPDISPNDIVRFHRMSLEEYRTGYQGICYSTKDLVIFPSKNLDAIPIHTSRNYTWTEDDKKTLSLLQSWIQASGQMNGHAGSGWLCAKTGKKIKLNGNLKNHATSPAKTTRTPPKALTRSPRSVSSVGTQTPPKLSPAARKLTAELSAHGGCPRNAISPAKQSQNFILSRAASPAHASEYPVETLSRSPRNLTSAKLSSDAETPDFIAPTPIKSTRLVIKRQLTFGDSTQSKRRNVERSSSSSPAKSSARCQQEPANYVEQISQTTAENVTGMSPSEVYPIFIDAGLPLNCVSIPVNGEDDPVITIRDLTRTKLFSRSRIQARVIATFPLPYKVQDSVHYECPHCDFIIPERLALATNVIFFQIGTRKCYLCPRCEAAEKKSKILKSSFVFGLRLDDGSMAINAYLYGRQAECFFKGLKPTSNNFSRVRELLSMVSCVALSRDSPPILDCFLKKYEMDDGHGFQIVDTRLL